MKRKILIRCAFPYCSNEPLVTDVPSCIDVVYVREQVTVNGRLVSRLVEKTVDRLERSKGTNYLDYCLENQIAIGATGLNKPVFLSSSDVDSTLNKLDELGFKLDAQQAAAVAQTSD